MSFGDALVAMQDGRRVTRVGWNGNLNPSAGAEPRMWICKGDGQADLPADRFWNPHTRRFAEGNGGKAEVLPYLILKSADGKILMGFLASQTDLLSTDWVVVSEAGIETVRGFDIPGTPSRRVGEEVEEVEYPVDSFGSESLEGEASSYDVAQEGITRRIWTHKYVPGAYASGDLAAIGTSTLVMAPSRYDEMRVLAQAEGVSPCVLIRAARVAEGMSADPVEVVEAERKLAAAIAARRAA